MAMTLHICQHMYIIAFSVSFDPTLPYTVILNKLEVLIKGTI